jgi:hypothetical protein
VAQGEGAGKKWFTCGCLGCLGLIVFLVVLVASLFGTAWVGVKSEEVSERVLEPDVPLTPGGVAGQPGRVVLRLSGGEFHVRPAEPGEALNVRAKYDTNAYNLTESFDTSGETWVYELDFERKGSMWMAMIKGLVGGAGSEVEVFLPQDVPLELEAEIEQGAVQMELGGLWLTSADLGFSQVGAELEISEPLREPMDRLKIRGSMGGIAVEGVGDASPRHLDVDFSMSGLDLDLRGQWRTDAEIVIRATQVGGAVRLPRDVEIVGLETNRVRPPVDPEVPRPTLTFTVSSSQGELEILE